MARFTLNLDSESGRFCRTIRVVGREPRFVQFLAGDVVDLDADEQQFLATEIDLAIIVPQGFVPRPKPKKPAPILDPREDDDPEEVLSIHRRRLTSESRGPSWASRTFDFFFPN